MEAKLETKKRAKYDKRLFFAVVLLTFFGYIMVISAHAPVWSKYGAGKFVFEIAKITGFIIIGFILMNRVRMRFDIKKIMKSPRLIFAIIIPLMLATLLFPEQNGAKAWIRIPGMTLQPVEFLKIVLILYYANHFGKNYGNNKSVFEIMKIPLIILLVSFVFVFVLQNDLGSALILVIISLCMFMAIPEKKYTKTKLVVLVILLISIVSFYAMGDSIANWIYSLSDSFPFKTQLIRIAVLFKPLEDVYASGFQVTNSLVALSRGGIFGMGLNESTIKFIIPEPYNDAIIAVIAEEFGLLGISFVFVMYTYIVSRLLGFASKSRILIVDRLILIGIASFFMAQFFVNVGGMVGLIPMTGVTLLFISSGGSSIITAFITIGIAQGVIKRYLK